MVCPETWNRSGLGTSQPCPTSCTSVVTSSATARTEGSPMRISPWEAALVCALLLSLSFAPTTKTTQK
jgi:hypothetical protein